MLARRVDVHTAMKAVDGWAGDSSLTYREPGGSGVRRRRLPRPLAPTTRRPWPTLLQQWKDVGPDTGATIATNGDTVHFTSCDPGKDVKLSGTDRSSDDVEYAAARIEIAEELMKANVPNSVAECSIDGTFDRLSLGQVMAIDRGSADAALQKKAQDALGAAVTACR